MYHSDFGTLSYFVHTLMDTDDDDFKNAVQNMLEKIKSIPDKKKQEEILQNLKDALLYVERIVAEKQIH
jgi:hypothetical protein